MTSQDSLTKPAEVECLERLLDQCSQEVRGIVQKALCEFAKKPGNISSFWVPVNQQCKILKEDDALADMIDNLLDSIRDNPATRQWILTNITGQ